MTIARLTTIVAFVATVSLVPAVAEQATFIKRPKTLGPRISTIITHATQDGSHFMCQAKCDPAAPYGYWQCEGTPSTVRCVLHCGPGKPQPECVHF